MDDFFLYLHLGFLALAVVGIGFADHAAFAWMRGDVAHLDRADLKRTHAVVTAGLCGLTLSGLYLFWPLRAYLLYQPLFWLKLGFVAALFVNAFLIEALMRFALEAPYRSLNPKIKRSLMLSGAVSTLSWLGAAGSAIFLFGWLF